MISIKEKSIEFYGCELKESNDEFLFCLTLYNEPAEKIINSVNSIFAAVSHLNSSNTNTICIIADGLDKISESTLSYFEELGNFSLNKIKKHADLHVFEFYNESKTRILLCVKEKNKGKLDSHWWFYRLVAEEIQPKYCIQIDAGVMIEQKLLHTIKEYLEEHDKVGALAIRLKLPEHKNDLDILRIWHHVDFEVEKIIEWSSEVLSGFLTVMPGQCSVVRWSSISDVVLDNYFIGLETSEPYELNRFLTEDRVLGCEIETHSDSGKITYFSKPVAISEEYEGSSELLRQRRRWFNGHFTCNVWSIPKFIKHLGDKNFGIKNRLHLLSSTVWTIINALILWIFPALMIILSSMFWGEMNNPISVIPQLTFVLLIGFQIFISLKRVSEKTIKAFKISGLIQLLLLGVGGIFYIFSGQYELLSISIITLYLLEMLNIVFNFYMYSKKNPVRMIRNVTLYSIIRPIMKLVLVIYAFINVHDNSWGTKNLNDRNIGLSLKKKYKNYRIKYLSLWFLTNIALILLYFISTTLTINLFIGLMLPYVVFRIISATYFNLKTFSQR